MSYGVFFLPGHFSRAPTYEDVVVGIDQGLFLFTDRLDARVRVWQRHVTESIQNPHHLFLIDHDRVGLFENLLGAPGVCTRVVVDRV